MVDARPFETVPHTPRGSAVLIHGFTGTPYEVKPLAALCAAHELACAAPLLAGHGKRENAAPINGTTAADWVRACKRAADRIADRAPGLRVAIGVSMGALVATKLVQNSPGAFDALVLVAPAFALRGPGGAVARLAQAGLGHLVPLMPKAGRGGDLSNAAARARNPGNHAIPIRGLGELETLRQEVVGDLSRVTCPVFVAHGLQDHTTEPAASTAALYAMQPAFSHAVYLPNAFHVLPLEHGRGALLSGLDAFLRDVAAHQA